MVSDMDGLTIKEEAADDGSDDDNEIKTASIPECEICGRKFSRKCDVSKHKTAGCSKLMNDESCSMCDVKFSSYSCLRKHIRRAHKETLETESSGDPKDQVDNKSYKCSMCDRDFLSKNGFTRHKQLCVKGEVNRFCKICNFTFSDSSGLRRHLRRKHKDNSIMQNESKVEEEVEMFEGSASSSLKNKDDMVPVSDNAVHSETLDNSLTVKTETETEVLVQVKNETEEAEAGKADKKTEQGQKYNATNVSSEGSVDGYDVKDLESNQNGKATENLDGIMRKPVFSCDVCKRTFSRNFALISHKTVHIPNQCSICGENLKGGPEWRNHRKKHMRSHKENVEKLPVVNNLNEKKSKNTKTNKETNKQIQCDVCKKTFTRVNAFLSHKRFHERPNQCNICGETFKCGPEWRNERRKHRRSHNRNIEKLSVMKNQDVEDNENDGKSIKRNELQCDVCYNIFTDINSLHEHNKIHLQPKQCSVCDETVFGIREFRNHSRQHKKPDKSYKKVFCHICGLLFASNSGYNRHMRKHEGKSYSCEICPKTFTATHSLKEHMRRHKGEKPFICEVCGKSFVARSKWLRHFRTHTGDKRYKCGTCNKAFIDSTSLKIHERVHSGIKPYACNLCNTKCMQKSSLVAHRRTHFMKRNFQCNICERKFASKNSLVKHSEMHQQTHLSVKPAYVTKPTLFCDKCPKGFITKRGLVRHTQKHLKGILPILRTEDTVDSEKNTAVKDNIVASAVQENIRDSSEQHASTEAQLPKKTSQQNDANEDLPEEYVERSLIDLDNTCAQREKLPHNLGSEQILEKNHYSHFHAFHQFGPCAVNNGPLNGMFLGSNVSDINSMTHVNIPKTYPVGGITNQVFQSNNTGIGDKLNIHVRVDNNVTDSLAERVETVPGSALFSCSLNTKPACRVDELRSKPQNSEKEIVRNSIESADNDLHIDTDSKHERVNMMAGEITRSEEQAVDESDDDTIIEPFDTASDSDFIGGAESNDHVNNNDCFKEPFSIFQVQNANDYKTDLAAHDISSKERSLVKGGNDNANGINKVNRQHRVECNLCLESFDNKTSLHYHLKEVHKQGENVMNSSQYHEENSLVSDNSDCEVQCMRCDEKFYSVLKLLTHLKQTCLKK